MQAIMTVPADALLHQTEESGAIKRYGFRICKAEQDPDKRVEYILDAKDFEPATVNATTGDIDLHSWYDVFFCTPDNNYPCMLNTGGTETHKFNVVADNAARNYKLSPTDANLTKLDGATGSDNAMVHFPICWVKRYEENGYEYFIVAEQRVDDTYHAFANTDASGAIKPFYHAMYKGSYIDSGYNVSTPTCANNTQCPNFSDLKTQATAHHTSANVAYTLRSLRGKAPEHFTCGDYERLSAKKNGANWDIRSWAQQALIADLCTLITKSENSQATLGQGVSSGYVADATQNNNILATGRGTAVTQFYGKQTTRDHVNVFWIEDFWANRWDRLVGLLCSGHQYYVKMTPEGNGYNFTGAGYEVLSDVNPAANGYQNITRMTPYGRLPVNVATGAEARPITDYVWTTNGNTTNPNGDKAQASYSTYGPNVGLAGGSCGAGSECGSRSLNLNAPGSWSGWLIGASLTCI